MQVPRAPPLPEGEVGARSAPGEGFWTLDRARNPLTPTLVWGFRSQAQFWPHGFLSTCSVSRLGRLSTAGADRQHESGGAGPSTDACTTRQSEASLPAVAIDRATTLYSVWDTRRGRSSGIRTMMQPCASAARLLGGGPILSLGTQAMGWGGSPPPRIVLALHRAEADERQTCLTLLCSLPVSAPTTRSR